MSNVPYNHDYVGTSQDGTWLYIVAVDYANKRVKIGPMGSDGGGNWLNEAAARACYNYEWGAKKQPWWRSATIVPDKCECGSGSDARSGAHSHWCKLWVAP